MPFEEYRRVKGVDVVEKKYIRDVERLVRGEVYRKAYEGIWDPDSISLEEHKKLSMKFGVQVLRPGIENLEKRYAVYWQS